MIQYIDHDTSVREEKRVHDELSFPRLVLVPLSRAVDCLLPGNPRCTEYASSSSSSSSTSTPSTYNPLLLSHRSHPPPLAADKLPTGTLWHPPRAPPHSLRAACSPHQEQPSTVHTLAHAHYKLWPWCPGTAAATAATSAAFSYLHKSLLSSSSYSSASSSTSSTPVTALLPLLAQLARFLFSIEVAGLYPRLTVSRFLFCVRASLTRLYLFFSFLRFQNLHSIYIYIGSFFSSSNLAFVPCHVCAFLFSNTRLMVLLFIGSFRFSYLISFLFRYFFSLLFLYSIVFLLVDFSSFFYRYLSLFVILSHFLSTYFHLYYSNISLFFLIILSLFFHRFLSSSLRYLSLFSTIVRVFSPCRFFLASSYFFLYFSLSLIRFCFSFSHIWFLVSSSSKREVRLEVCFVSRTRASLEFLSLRSRRSRSTDSPHPSFLPAPPDDSGIRYNEFRSSYFQDNVIGDV